MSRYLGVDYGTKRVGLAISDGLGLTARPLEVVAHADLEASLHRIAGDYDIVGAVVGLPTALRGHEGDSAEAAREMGGNIADILDVPVHYIDERFTSRIAESVLLESGMRRRDRRQTVDKISAAIILQSFLDARHRPGNSDHAPVGEPGDDR